jgi:hypothetical protein
MSKVIRYEVVYGNSEQAFVQQVNDMIKQGWQPIGGIATTYIEKTQQAVSHQAMVLYKSNSDARLDDLYDALT